MRHPPYPKYKPSGVEWLGDVPEHWEVRRLRHLISRLDQGWSPNANASPAIEDEWGVLKLSAARYGRFFPSENKALDEVPDGAPLVTPQTGDLLVSRSNTPERVGDACLVLEDYPRRIVPDLLYRVKLNLELVHPAYLCGFLLSRSARAQIESDARGSSGSMVKLAQSHLRGWLTPCPPPPEQRAIADFLDRETAKIDTLVAKKRTLVERLKEKRTALISRTVTRGLPPDAARAAGLDPHPKLKPSGIDWLGDVPEHWEVTKMRRVCRSIRDGTHNPPERADGIHRLLSVRNVQSGEFVLLDDDRTMSPEDFAELQRSYTVEAGDIVLAIVGATTGKSAIVRRLEGVTVQRSLAILRPTRRAVSSAFLHYIIQSPVVQTEIELTVFKYSAQPGIYLEDIAQLPVVRPPIDEQSAIAAYLGEETARLDALVERVEAALERLQEYRSVLITASVTGKIDVRTAAVEEAVRCVPATG